jgi:hypothetical protein
MIRLDRSNALYGQMRKPFCRRENSWTFID